VPPHARVHALVSSLWLPPPFYSPPNTEISGEVGSEQCLVRCISLLGGLPLHRALTGLFISTDQKEQIASISDAWTARYGPL
jgi:hypothetical protein